ncbi:MAG: tRNA (N(6)-L-threonylcarbamoyladenosine(37)-C(2))-methylthiotransferase MtaB [Fusobacteria bacterium]|nr:tRNA (N(6)-L-threonylcarbamoyladenosine(37)-C(2))-methylthiotransferase MtaB [Fusobacteriota bacterium]
MKYINTVAFYTLGCKVNQYETESIKQQFLDNNVKIVNFDENADVYIVNTCTVTSIADRKTRNILRRAKKINSSSILVATGCYAQTDGDELKKFPEIDLIVGNSNKNHIFKIISEYIRTNENDINYVENIYLEDIFKDLNLSTYREMNRAYIKIQDGCNNYCSYCKIPFARGKSRSRTSESILNEAITLSKDNFKEIILIGINLGAYGLDLNSENINLEKIIDNISKIDGITRIRLGSVYPDRLTDDFVEMLKNNKKLMPHLHISLQSGDDFILNQMGRAYKTKDIEERLTKIREEIPNIMFTGDVIVGFPGETDDYFKNTYNFINKISFSDLHIFKYSERKNTKAISFKMKVPSNIKNERALLLEKLNHEMYLKERLKNIGKTDYILVEELKNQNAVGYTENYLKAIIKNCKKEINEIVKVKIIGYEKEMLICEESR